MELKQAYVIFVVWNAFLKCTNEDPSGVKAYSWGKRSKFSSYELAFILLQTLCCRCASTRGFIDFILSVSRAQQARFQRCSSLKSSSVRLQLYWTPDTRARDLMHSDPTQWLGYWIQWYCTTVLHCSKGSRLEVSWAGHKLRDVVEREYESDDKRCVSWLLT